MLKPKAVIVIASILATTMLSFLTFGEEQQDFGISKEDIIFSNDSPTEGENITISVNVHSYNIQTTAFANLTIYLDDETKIIGYDWFSVGSGNRTYLSNFYWNTSFQQGKHLIIAKLHSFNFGENITNNDGNLSNNIANKTIYVKKRADLTLSKEDITFSKNPANEGELVIIKATIKNIGETNALNFKVAFYNNTISNESKIGFAVLSVNANSSSFVQINYDTTNQYGNHRIIVFADYLNQTNETNEYNNIAQNSLRVVNEYKDIIINKTNYYREIDIDKFVQTGFIFVRDNGTFVLRNTILSLWQRWENQFDIILEDDGKIIISNGTIKDYDEIYSFNIYIFNQTSLVGNEAIVKTNINGISIANFNLTNSLIEGNVNLALKEFSLFYSMVITDVFNLTAEKILINDTVLNTISDIYINPIVYFYSKNSSFHKLMLMPDEFLLDDFQGNSISYLLNTTIDAPIQKEISAKENAVVWRYWYLTVEVKDDAFLPIKNAKVSILYYPKPFLIETLYKTGYTDENGKVIFILESDNFNYQGRNFLGNYNLSVEYENLKLFKRDIPPLHNNMIVNIGFNSTLIDPRDVYEETERDIKLKDNETAEITSPYKQQGNIVLKDSSTLIIKNTSLNIEQVYDYQYFLFLKDNSTLTIDNGKIESNFKIILYLYGNSTLILKNNATLSSTIIARFISVIFIDNTTFKEQINARCSLVNISSSTIKGDLTLKSKNINFIFSNITSNILVEAEKIEIVNTEINTNLFSFKTNIFNSTNTRFNKQLLFSGNTIATLINTSAELSVKENAKVDIYWYLTLIVKDNVNNTIGNSTVNIFSYINLKEKLYKNTTTNSEGKIILPLLTKTIDSKGSYYIGNYRIVAFYQNYTTNKIDIIIEDANLIKEIKFNETLTTPKSINITADYYPKEIFVGDLITISGYVKFATETPVEDAEITLKVGSTPYITKTDKNGFYVFEIEIVDKGEIKINITAQKDLNVSGNISTIVSSIEISIMIKEKPTPPTPINWFAIIISLAVIIATITVISYYFREKLRVLFLIFYLRFIKRQEMAECSDCKKLIPITTNKCLYCGAEFERELIRCSKCEAMIPVSAEKCEFCGAEFTKKGRGS